MKKLIPLAMAAMIGAVPATLHAQAATAQDRIQAAIERAQHANIPGDLVQMKVREGLAKGVPADRIAAAADRRANALIGAQDALIRAGVQPTRDDLTVGADALGAGVSAAALEAIAATSPAERRLVAVAVLTELVAAGHLPDQALARVEQALARGGDALAQLPAQAAAARAGQGGPPGKAGQGRRGPPQGVPAPGQRPRSGPPGGGNPPGGF